MEQQKLKIKEEAFQLHRLLSKVLHLMSMCLSFIFTVFTFIYIYMNDYCAITVKKVHRNDAEIMKQLSNK